MTPAERHPDAARRPPGVTALIALGPVLLLTALVYWPGLYGALMLDDYSNLEPLLRFDAGELSWGEVVFKHEPRALGRPVTLLSFLLNWLATGGDVWFLKLTNLLLHLLTGTLVFWLAGRLLGLQAAHLDGRHWWLALWVAATWLLTPVALSAVLYVVQRGTQLAALFTLSGLLCYVAAREQLQHTRVRGIALLAAAFGLFWPLAVLSKENGVLLPLLALAVECYFFRWRGSRAERQLLGAVFTATLLLPLAAVAVLSVQHPDTFFAEYRFREFGPGERLLTESRVLFDYLGNVMMIPGGSPLGLYHDDFAVSRGLLSPPTTLVCTVAWLALLAAVWIGRRAHWRILFFGPLFYLAAHSLESSVLPLELYHEHRNYLPAVGVFVGLGLAAARLLATLRRPALLVAVLALMPLVYAAATHQRAGIWRSWEGVLLASHYAHPGSPRVHTGLASIYLNRGELDTAFAHLRRAAELYGGRHAGALALHALSARCVSDAMPANDAYTRLEQLDGIESSAYTLNTLAWLTGAVERGSCPALDAARVARALRRALAIDSASTYPGRWRLHVYAARLLAQSGHPHEALEALQRAAALAPDQPIAHLLAVEYRLQIGDTAGARASLRAARAGDTRKLAQHTRLIERYEQRLRAAGN